MPARQYCPFSYLIRTTPLIIYPVIDEPSLHELLRGEDGIKHHLDELYQRHQATFSKSTYHIVFVWSLEGHIMTDVWLHNMEFWNTTSGPLLECHTFRDLEKCNDAGIASGDTIIVLGREEELRRSLPDIATYVNRALHTPTFPFDMQPVERFL